MSLVGVKLRKMVGPGCVHQWVPGYPIPKMICALCGAVKR
jgi:hypothetical protein